MRQDKLITEVLGGDVSITPSDLYSKQFRRVVFGGYHAQAVGAYLERVGDALEALIRQGKELKAQCEEYKARVEEYQQMETTLRSALVTSQKFGENLIDSARREADSLIAAARVEKERMLIQAGKLPGALVHEIDLLQQQRDSLRKEILGILATHRTLLESVVSAEEGIGLARSGGTAGTVYFGAEKEQEPRPERPQKAAGDMGSFVPASDEPPGTRAENEL